MVPCRESGWLMPRRVQILTFCRTPAELTALVNLGVTEILTPFPGTSDFDTDIAAMLDHAAQSAVQVWFVCDDISTRNGQAPWVATHGHMASDHRVGILGRHISTLRTARQAFPRARLAYGPWPKPGGDAEDAALQELGVSLVWAPAWKEREDAVRLAEHAGRIGVELVLPLPRSFVLRQWEADRHVGHPMFHLVAHERIHWAVAVDQQRTLADRFGELLEVKTILAAKLETPLGIFEEPAPGAFPYRQTEGFPVVYADLLRHPQGLQVASVDPTLPSPVADAREWDHAPSLLSAYIHVPFCVRRCRFCYCASSGVTGRDRQLRQDYVDSVCREIDLWSQSPVLGDRLFSTLYVGGGSPSALTQSQLSRVLGHATKTLPFVEDMVLSLEMAPSSISREKLVTAKESGANRLSYGIQSFTSSTLERLGSAHTRAAALRSLELAADTGFTDVDIDLICGVPGQSLDSFLDDLQTACDLQVASIMFFPIHVTPHLLEWWASQGLDSKVWTAPRYDRFWREADSWLSSHGYVRFGYSHYKRALATGDENAKAASDRYFSRYMYVMPGSDGQLALGPGAIGCVAHRQYENICQVGEYVQRLKTGLLPIRAYCEPPQQDSSLVWFAIERSTYPGVVQREEVVERFGLRGWTRLEELLQPMVEKKLFTRSKGSVEITQLGIVWMGNVQIELLRAAGLPAPVGHLMAL